MSNAEQLPPLDALEVTFVKMAALVETQLSDSIAAFERLDVGAAAAVVSGDAAIDDAHREIEDLVFAALSGARLSPDNVRAVLTTFKVAGDLERIGDLAKNVAKRVPSLSAEPRIDALGGVVAMGRASRLQISRVLDAYGARNLKAARSVWGGDQTIDDHYYALYQAILRAMSNDPLRASACTHLVFIAKNFERIGDHATNIAESLYFLVTGAPLVGDRPKGDDTPTSSLRPTD